MQKKIFEKLSTFRFTFSKSYKAYLIIYLGRAFSKVKKFLKTWKTHVAQICRPKLFSYLSIADFIFKIPAFLCFVGVIWPCHFKIYILRIPIDSRLFREPIARGSLNDSY